ncbi:hypothetical protein FD755_023545 [Muntiacus reevesi]|uniref:Peptidase S1 domain-containing protein n=1 Tax=Muntiacus reevesi TaxID=9886 RepID=A0A5N3VXR3_MUNRE|nr:hypothetical protein FD755_024906 [Muntiacus reevesi]KAB0353761.1 hypothetical protein FD755_023545 [Muntiacus reevesi]
MQLLLLLMAFLLPPELGQPFLSEEITGGHKAKPHSRPYMALLQFLGEKSWKRCGGVLTQKDFVLTAAHCGGSSMSVTLGAHNIKQQERTQQVIQVRRAIRHPEYNPKTFSNDIMLLQLERKAKQTAAVKPLSLPRAKAREAELTVQADRVCETLYPSHYSRATQICVRDPRKAKTGFKVMVHGTFSYGTMNGIPPGVFTQVSHFLPWIKRAMKCL